MCKAIFKNLNFKLNKGKVLSLILLFSVIWCCSDFRFLFFLLSDLFYKFTEHFDFIFPKIDCFSNLGIIKKTSHYDYFAKNCQYKIRSLRKLKMYKILKIYQLQ